MIECRNIRKSYGDLQVLKGISLTVEQREIVSVTGPSGAGKTTLLQIMGTLDSPDCGEVHYKGFDVLRLKDSEMARFRNKNIGFVFQFHQLLPEFTAVENVMLPALIGGKSLSETKKSALELIAFLGLETRADHKPAELSGGEKQRVAVARALINKPQIVLADEPSGSLDTQNKAELHKMFLDLRREYGQTFVIVTHDTELAAIADRSIFMRDGEIIQTTSNIKTS